MVKSTILVPTPFFPPAYKAGGAAKSVGNLVETLGGEYRFLVHALASDLDGSPLDVPSSRTIGASTVTYHAVGAFTRKLAAELMDGADLVYLNGFFAPTFSLKVAFARRFRITRPPLLVAPRGELFPAPLRIKPLKKRVAMAGIRVAGLYADAQWHASDEREGEAITAIARRLGQRAPVVYPACDLPGEARAERDPPYRAVPRVVFFARIAPKKNLLFALRALAETTRPIELDVIGPIEETDYWNACEAAIAALPPQHRVRYLGAIAPHQVADTLADYDLYFFPTKSENYGHTIQEALAAGLPALISDQTPWRDLAEANAGWDLPLVESRFAEALDAFARSDARERIAGRVAARTLSRSPGQGDAVEAHRAMFERALAHGQSPGRFRPGHRTANRQPS